MKIVWVKIDMSIKIVPGNCLVCNHYDLPVRQHPELDPRDAICERCEKIWFCSRYPAEDWQGWYDTSGSVVQLRESVTLRSVASEDSVRGALVRAVHQRAS